MANDLSNSIHTEGSVNDEVAKSNRKPTIPKRVRPTLKKISKGSEKLSKDRSYDAYVDRTIEATEKHFTKRNAILRRMENKIIDRTWAKYGKPKKSAVK